MITGIASIATTVTEIIRSSLGLLSAERITEGAVSLLDCITQSTLGLKVNLSNFVQISK